MPVITFSRVAEHVSDVTAEQIGKCSKIIGPDDRAYYCVENERGERFEGEILTYAVRYSCQTGFTCTCPAGATGFSVVHHRSGVCKHCRWVVAFVLEERAYYAELAAAEEHRREATEGPEFPDGLPAATAVAKESTPFAPPAWYDPANETSVFHGTRRELIKTGSKECDDATYARVVNANAQPTQYSEDEIKRAQDENGPHPFNFWN